MRLFLDCEFNEFQGELISMALVAEDGREWYEVIPCDNPGAWVAQHVIPILGKPALPDKAALTASLCLFLQQFEKIHIIADWPEDIAHFCNALITGPGSRIDTPPLVMEVLRVDAESEQPHNALADAYGIRSHVLFPGLMKEHPDYADEAADYPLRLAERIRLQELAKQRKKDV